MAAINLNVQCSYVSGNASASFTPGSIGITQNTQGGHFPIVSVTTAPTAVGFGSVGTPGIIVGRSLAASTATSYVLVGPTTTSTGTYRPFLKIKGGEPFAFRLNSNLWKWKASAGTIKVLMQIFED